MIGIQWSFTRHTNLHSPYSNIVSSPKSGTTACVFFCCVLFFTARLHATILMTIWRSIKNPILGRAILAWRKNSNSREFQKVTINKNRLFILFIFDIYCEAEYPVLYFSSARQFDSTFAASLESVFIAHGAFQKPLVRLLARHELGCHRGALARPTAPAADDKARATTRRTVLGIWWKEKKQHELISWCVVQEDIQAVCWTNTRNECESARRTGLMSQLHISRKLFRLLPAS